MIGYNCGENSKIIINNSSIDKIIADGSEFGGLIGKIPEHKNTNIIIKSNFIKELIVLTDDLLWGGFIGNISFNPSQFNLELNSCYILNNNPKLNFIGYNIVSIIIGLIYLKHRHTHLWQWPHWHLTDWLQ